MFVLLGVLCLFSKLDCTTLGMVGHPYDTKDKCIAVKDQLDKAIKPVEWLYGQFECVEDHQI